MDILKVYQEQPTNKTVLQKSGQSLKITEKNSIINMIQLFRDKPLREQISIFEKKIKTERKIAEADQKAHKAEIDKQLLSAENECSSIRKRVETLSKDKEKVQSVFVQYRE